LRPAHVAAAIAIAYAIGGCKPEAHGPAVRRSSGTRRDAAAVVVRADAGPTVRLFATAAEALRVVIARERPRVVGFGEYHQRTDSAKVASAVSRFTLELLPEIAGAASDIVVETWVVESGCGETAKKVARKVEKTTKRPENTESEVVALLVRAKKAGIAPHLLEVGCDEYKSLLGGEELSHEKLLELITKHLRVAAEKILARSPARSLLAPEDGGASRRGLVILYGGALHNDLYPYEELKRFSYAEALARRTGGRYVEVDLYVPELIEGDETLSTEAFYPLFERASKEAPGKVQLIERGARSYILIFPRTILPSNP
jgi:hypothetical protein